MLVTLTFGLSAILTGWLADVFTAETTALAMGGVALVWAIVWTLLTGHVRRATMLEGCGPAPELLPEPAEVPTASVTRRVSPVVAVSCPRARGWARAAVRRGDLRSTERHTGSLAAERHLWRPRFAERVLHLEELFLLEVERRRDDHGRELLHALVVVADVRVVEAARRLQPVLGVRQLLLEREEVLVGLEVRVVLDHGEQLAQGRRAVLGRGLFGR